MRNPNGFGSVINLGVRRRKPFAVRITAGWTNEGKQKYKYLSYHESQVEAMIALAEFNKNPYDINNYKITFEELFKNWSEIKFDKISHSSIRAYKLSYSKCKSLYKKPFKEIRANHLQAVIDSTDSPALNQKIKSLFKQLYSFARLNDLVDRDYSDLVTIEKSEPKQKILFTKNEIKTLWNNVNTVAHTDVFLILLYTGLRIGELLDLKTNNVDLENRIMHIEKSKTSAGIRNVPIHKDIYKLIEYRFNLNNTYLISTAKNNKMTYSNFNKTFLPDIYTLLDETHTPHDTRHTFISRGVFLDLNKLILKRIVGHSNQNVTEHYTQIDNEKLIETIDKFSYDL